MTIAKKDLIILFFSEHSYLNLERYAILKKYYSEIKYIDYKNSKNRIVATVNCTTGNVIIEEQSNIRNYSLKEYVTNNSRQNIVSFYDSRNLQYFDKNWSNIISKNDITILFFKINQDTIHVKIEKIFKNGQKPHYKIQLPCKKEVVDFVKSKI